MCHLVARELHKVAAPFMYIVQLYKDWGILRMLGCPAVALPSTKQIVKKHTMKLDTTLHVITFNYNYVKFIATRAIHIVLAIC